MAALALKGVSKMFAGPVTAVEDLDLEIQDQELVVLVGPSGCGKTTTLRLIAGLEEPDRGAIWIDGRQVNGVAPRERNIAMVFQHSVLYPHMTVYQNMAAGLRWRSGGQRIRRCWRRWRDPAEARRQSDTPRAIAKQVQDASRILGIEHLLDRFPRQLSGGECQRVALGRAIVRQPAAFLLDEPLSHLDAQLRVEMRREIKRLHQRLQGTVVYVTHDQAEALALGDRIVVMHRGRIQQAGPPREVYERPANVFVAAFLGTPGMNLIPGRCQRDAHGCRFASAGLTLALPATAVPARGEDGERPVILGVRAERLWLRPTTARSTARSTGGEATTRVAGTGRVVVSELAGPSVLVTVALHGASQPDAAASGAATERGQRRIELVVAMPPGETVEMGQEVAVGVDPSWIRLFDANTGNRVSPTRPGDNEPT